MNATETTPWLKRLGEDELRLVKELGWDHPAVIQAQHRFRDGFEAVNAIRKAYGASSPRKKG